MNITPEQLLTDTRLCETLFPRHKVCLSINHNNHRVYHESIERYIDDLESGSSSPWKDSNARERAIDTDELWEMTWFPDTSAGSYSICAPTLTELLTYAKEIELTDS